MSAETRTAVSMERQRCQHIVISWRTYAARYDANPEVLGILDGLAREIASGEWPEVFIDVLLD
jgi:hypothetical protein